MSIHTREEERTVQTVDEREAAVQHLRARRDFISHLGSYVVVNGLLIGIWAMTGFGYFWPAWVVGCWGAGLVLHAWEAFLRRPMTESDVDAEIRRQHRHR